MLENKNNLDYGNYYSNLAALMFIAFLIVSQLYIQKTNENYSLKQIIKQDSIEFVNIKKKAIQDSKIYDKIFKKLNED